MMKIEIGQVWSFCGTNNKKHLQYYRVVNITDDIAHLMFISGDALNEYETSMLNCVFEYPISQIGLHAKLVKNYQTKTTDSIYDKLEKILNA